MSSILPQCHKHNKQEYIDNISQTDMSGKAGYAYNVHAQVSKMFTKIFKTKFFVAPIKK